jgi:hypothetical protein
VPAKAPAHLSKESKRWWNQVISAYDLLEDGLIGDCLRYQYPAPVPLAQIRASARAALAELAAFKLANPGAVDQNIRRYEAFVRQVLAEPHRAAMTTEAALHLHHRG